MNLTNTEILPSGDIVQIRGEEVVRWPKRDTAKAICLMIEGTTMFLPKKMVVDDPRNGSIRITRWIAEQKGILQKKVLAPLVLSRAWNSDSETPEEDGERFDEDWI